MPKDFMPDTTAAALHNRMFFRLFQLGNTLERQAMKVLGITPVQWAVLGALSTPESDNGILFSDLADYLLVSRQNLDGVLKRLERDACIERVPDATDRRAKRVRLTATGHTAWEHLQSEMYRFYDQALRGFSLDDKVALMYGLNRLNAGLNTIEPSSQPDTD